MWSDAIVSDGALSSAAADGMSGCSAQRSVYGCTGSARSAAGAKAPRWGGAGAVAGQRAVRVDGAVSGRAGFYELLAMEALGRAITVPPDPPALKPGGDRLPPKRDRALADRAALIAMTASACSTRWRCGSTTGTPTVRLHTPGGMPERELLDAVLPGLPRRAVAPLRRRSSERNAAGCSITGQRFPPPTWANFSGRLSAFPR